MQHTRAQVMTIFAAALPVLLGFLGLVLDGGFYLAVGETTQFAVAAAARAAAADVSATAYASATTDGTTVGQRNLSTLQLSGITLSLQYNNTASAAPGAAGWSSATPTANTWSVKATASGTYNTLFLKLLQVPTVQVQRLAVVTLSYLLPLGVCQAVSNAMDASPARPQVIWDRNSSQCGVNR